MNVNASPAVLVAGTSGVRAEHTVFSAPLGELRGLWSETTRIDGHTLVIDHVYIERRLEPLNLYIEEREPRAAELAILDYGQAIKDLALTNIFPGDLLLGRLLTTDSPSGLATIMTQKCAN